MAQEEERRKNPKPPPRAKLLQDLAKARRYHKEAVRWLFDCSRLRSMYQKSSESWRETSNEEDEEMIGVADASLSDAEREVILTRSLVNRAAKKLKEYDERNIQ